MTYVNNQITDAFDTLIQRGYDSLAFLVDGPTIFYKNGKHEPSKEITDKEEFIADMDALGMDATESGIFTYYHHTPNEFVHEFTLDITVEKSRIDPAMMQLTVFVRLVKTMLKTELDEGEDS